MPLTLVHATFFAPLQASENSKSFWSFIETWQEPNNEVDDSCWGAVYASASQHLSNGSSMSLQQALAARQYTAKVEMLRNLAEIPQVPSRIQMMPMNVLVHWSPTVSHNCIPSTQGNHACVLCTILP